MTTTARILIATLISLGLTAAKADSLFDISDVLGSNVTSHTERWTGLGTGSSPSNSGDLDPNNPNEANRGIIPNSMNANTRLTKISGGGYRAGASIYWQSGMGGFTGPDPFPVMMNVMAGTVTPQQAASYVTAGYKLDGEGQFRINSTFETPQQFDAIVFQLAISGFGPTLEAFHDGTYVSSYEFVLMLNPVTLTINGTEQIAGTFRNLSYTKFDSNQGEGAYEVEEVWAFEWDLSNLSVPIESYTIGFANYPHASIRGLQVDAVNVIPEPSTYALIVIGCTFTLWIRNRKNRQRYGIVS